MRDQQEHYYSDETTDGIITEAIPFDDEESGVVIAMAVASSCHTRSITILFVSWVVLVVLLFTVPRYAVHTGGDGLGDISQALSYVLVFGIAIFGVSIASLWLTIHDWSQLVPCTKILGLAPIIGTAMIVVVIALLVARANDESDPVSPMPCYGDECLTPKE